MSNNNYDNIKEGEKKQVNKVEREIDGVKYWEYTYITKLENGRIHKQTVKSKYTPKNKDSKPRTKNSKSKSSDSENDNSNNDANARHASARQEQEQEQKIKMFVNEYKKQMLISLQSLIKTQFNESLTIEELKDM